MSVKTPENAIEALSYLLEQWAAMITNQQREGASRELFSVWHKLAHVLCGPETERLRTFLDEIDYSWKQGRPGYPPVRALEQLLHDLETIGGRSLFVAVSIRQVMDQLIALYQPAESEEWAILADNILPKRALIGHMRDEMPGPRSTFGPRPHP